MFCCAVVLYILLYYFPNVKLYVDYSGELTVQCKTFVGENFGGVGTARKLAEKTLTVGRGKPIQY